MSPTERQVPHALLTRSPLNLISFGRNRIPLSPVRLACVRHAASVRPEPGSNSQKIVSKAPECLKSCFLNNLLLAIYYSRISLAVLLRFRLNNPFFVVQGVCSSLRYSIYKVHLATRSAVSLVILTPISSFVKNFFQ